MTDPFITKSFANIAKATPDQLRNLPGFGQVKVKNIKNTFDKPMRNNATRTLPTATQESSDFVFHDDEPPTTMAALVSKSTKGKEKALPSTTTRPPRESSPIWDIELDLDEPSSVAAKDPPPRTAAPFDIELDLN